MKLSLTQSNCAMDIKEYCLHKNSHITTHDKKEFIKFHLLIKKGFLGNISEWQMKNLVLWKKKDIADGNFGRNSMVLPYWNITKTFRSHFEKLTMFLIQQNILSLSLLTVIKGTIKIILKEYEMFSENMAFNLPRISTETIQNAKSPDH